MKHKRPRLFACLTLIVSSLVACVTAQTPSVPVPPTPTTVATTLPAPTATTTETAIPTSTPLDDQITRVLFIGNSLTFYNELPAMFAALARSGGHEVEAGMSAQGGLSLADHATSTLTLNTMAEQPWDFVVLQERGGIPAVPEQRERHMYPAIRLLDEMILGMGATPVLFMTWGIRDGLPSEGIEGYEAMQAAVETGYLEIAAELDVTVAPVGIAWQQGLAREPGLNLWQPDGGHPTREGTYLAACVFYAVIFGDSPEGLSYQGGLPEERAGLLQSVAADTVFANTERWHLPFESVPSASPAPYLATPVADSPAAGICAAFDDPVFTVQIHPYIPDPRCVRIRGDQMLSVSNQTLGGIEVVIGQYAVEIPAGESYTFEKTFGEYLAPGVHHVQVTPCCGFELWLGGE